MKADFDDNDDISDVKIEEKNRKFIDFILKDDN